jgi:hypothetical protein
MIIVSLLAIGGITRAIDIVIIRITFIKFSDGILSRNKLKFSFSNFKLINKKNPIITIEKPIKRIAETA